jgi:hypothetical protein
VPLPKTKKKKIRAYGHGHGQGHGQGYGWIDEEGLQDDEHGHRELQDLVQMTSIAGNRVKDQISAMRFGFEIGYHMGRERALETGRPKGARSIVPDSIPFRNVWRTSSYDQVGVGETLKQALAVGARNTGMGRALGMRPAVGAGVGAGLGLPQVEGVQQALYNYPVA